ncbi:DUF3999 family protein [Maribacter sp. 4G9]|uniref:DUF3999 family protein n=1 Tax=Maribacter sp. 4G9 TaxID=1889777 RepID=UPI000C14AFFC|nr:DUF3999 family protein [Maribacter sp. 4G9]PIB25323.1 hypothetical protein BFP75_09845 [Maribacter sp. 4G9]
MRTRTKIATIALLGFGVASFGQIQNYDKQIRLSGITEQWHSIALPDTLFADVQNGLADIRVYGVTEIDTLEAPYLLQVSHSKGDLSKIDFKLINSSSNKNGYYYTYEIPTSKSINEIQLSFKDENFDWNVTLEGSQNQQEWFTVLEDYRILSIKNNQTDYSFTHLNFPNAKYRYYRLLVKSDSQPNLVHSSLNLDSIIPAKYRDYAIETFDVIQENKNSVITIDLKARLPISYIKLDVSDKVDYYRPMEITYVSDSVKTEKGWRYRYSALTAGTLSSLEDNTFKFKTVLAQRLQVLVHNYDNEPLAISKPEVKGYTHKLLARFDKPATYFLVYGNQNARTPIYDISKGGFKLPENVAALILDKPEPISKNTTVEASPLFENKWWLWGIMGIIMLVLGVFTLKMVRKEN